MNVPLKVKIIEKYGRQVDFARVVGVRDAKVSRVIHGRDSLPPEDQTMWARKLGANREELFAG